MDGARPDLDDGSFDPAPPAPDDRTRLESELPSDDPAIGQRSLPPAIDGYDLLGSIGRGGMGEVYLARQRSLGGRLVAIKFLPAGLDPETDERYHRFRREAELMARVQHSHVLSAIDFGQAEGRPFLVVEHVAGGDLRRLMRPGSPMSPEQARPILRAVGEALSCLHRNGILHRDLKPENILLHEDGRPKLADFGIAVLKGKAGNFTHTRVGLGTPGYVSHEQHYGLPVDERTDQYSLAALAYELLTGQVPLGILRPPSQIVRSLGPAVDQVLTRALQEDRDDRFPSVAEFCVALDDALAPSRPTAAAESPTPPDPRRSRRFATLVALAAVLSLAVIAAVVTWRRYGDQPSPSLVDDPDSKVVIADPPSPPRPNDALALAIRDQVDDAAFRLWEGRGEPPGTQQQDWLDALRDLLGHGPLAAEIETRIGDLAYRIWESKGRPENGTELADWVAARDEFLDKGGLDGVLDDAIRPVADLISRRRNRSSDDPTHDWFTARSWLEAQGLILPRYLVNGLGIRMLLVPTAPRGLPPDGPLPPPPFYLSESEITAGQYASIQASDRAASTPLDFPATELSWNDADAFCRSLEAKEHLPYRLPAVGQWRLAASGGPSDSSRLSVDEIDTLAWSLENAKQAPHGVHLRGAGPLGFHDLFGNVAEWCADPCDTLNRRPIIGGSWEDSAEELLDQVPDCLDASFRSTAIGFRICLPAPGRDPAPRD